MTIHLLMVEQCKDPFRITNLLNNSFSVIEYRFYFWLGALVKQEIWVTLWSGSINSILQHQTRNNVTTGLMGYRDLCLFQTLVADTICLETQIYSVSIGFWTLTSDPRSPAECVVRPIWIEHVYIINNMCWHFVTRPAVNFR